MLVHINQSDGVQQPLEARLLPAIKRHDHRGHAADLVRDPTQVPPSLRPRKPITSLIASPKRLRQITVTNSTRPGNVIVHQLLRKYVRALAIIPLAPAWGRSAAGQQGQSMPCPRCQSDVVTKDGTTPLGGQRFR